MDSFESREEYARSGEALTVIKPESSGEAGERLERVLSYALAGRNFEVIAFADGMRPLPGRRILFALSLDAGGISGECLGVIRWLRMHPGSLNGAVAGILADGDGELFTKSAARDVALAANGAGAAFVGKPLVEGTGSLKNFRIIAANMGTELLEAYKRSARDLADQVAGFCPARRERPKLLVLHASSHKTSNTYALWEMVKRELSAFEITEIGLRNGTLSDCAGCPYSACLHFGEKGSCFYGGVMVDAVYPAVKRADAILLLCPNYNDALSANLTAFINRLTALFRNMRFYDKAIYALVVSGYSGSDIVAGQVISALNMNKTFFLPGRFTMMETANSAGEILTLPGIGERAAAFGRRMDEYLRGGVL